jgi:hypothetical protein
MAIWIGLLAFDFGGCTVKECDSDTEDCGIGDSDADVDVDADSDSDTCDPVADDSACDDLTMLRLCDDSGHYQVFDCSVECADLGGGGCDVYERGFACVCAGVDCDFSTWDNATMDTCSDEGHVHTCVEGNTFAEVDCMQACQDAGSPDGACATLPEEPGYGCVCGSGDACTAGTPDSCVDDDVVQRCVNDVVITESCQNWCQVEEGSDGLCDPDSQTCTCF